MFELSARILQNGSGNARRDLLLYRCHISLPFLIGVLLLRLHQHPLEQGQIGCRKRAANIEIGRICIDIAALCQQPVQQRGCIPAVRRAAVIRVAFFVICRNLRAVRLRDRDLIEPEVAAVGICFDIQHRIFAVLHRIIRSRKRQPFAGFRIALRKGIIDRAAAAAVLHGHFEMHRRAGSLHDLRLHADMHSRRAFFAAERIGDAVPCGSAAGHLGSTAARRCRIRRP